MSDKYFATEDFGFATFLKAEGIDLKGVGMVDERINKCEFIFIVDENSEQLKKLKSEWIFSERVKRDKRILFSSKILKRALKDFLIEFNKNRNHKEGKYNSWRG